MKTLRWIHLFFMIVVVCLIKAFSFLYTAIYYPEKFVNSTVLQLESPRFVDRDSKVTMVLHSHNRLSGKPVDGKWSLWLWTYSQQRMKWYPNKVQQGQLDLSGQTRIRFTTPKNLTYGCYFAVNIGGEDIFGDLLYREWAMPLNKITPTHTQALKIHLKQKQSNPENTVQIHLEISDKDKLKNISVITLHSALLKQKTTLSKEEALELWTYRGVPSSLPMLYRQIHHKQEKNKKNRQYLNNDSDIEKQNQDFSDSHLELFYYTAGAFIPAILLTALVFYAGQFFFKDYLRFFFAFSVAIIILPIIIPLLIIVYELSPSGSYKAPKFHQILKEQFYSSKSLISQQNEKEFPGIASFTPNIQLDSKNSFSLSIPSTPCELFVIATLQDGRHIVNSIYFPNIKGNTEE